MIARMSCEPTLDFVMFMSCVIVHYQMDVYILWDVLVDVLEKLEIFLMAMASFTSGEDFAGSDV
jgi:hypothetical protein